MTRSPIFIHSMFRAGSTYFFQVFRRVGESSYWCYQEPLHELFSDFQENSAACVELTSSQNQLLRHPVLDKPYLAEYVPLVEKIGANYRQTFPYISYFDNQEAGLNELRQYLAMLSEEAPARPVIQCCRTTARLLSLRKHFPATHVFLWRNPWDQWWSYKVVPYFDTANLLILSSPSAPPLIRELRKRLGVDIIPDGITTEVAFAHNGERLLSSADSYRIFYALWLMALQQGFANADIQISIDALSTSESYRNDVLVQFREHGVYGIDFSDCQMHRGVYTSRDEDFFRPLEAEIQALFIAHHEDIFALQNPEVVNAHAEMYCHVPPAISRWSAACEDMTRMRELIIRSESFRNQAQRNMIAMRLEIERLLYVEAKLQSIYQSIAWRVISPFLMMYWRLRASWRSYRASDQSSKHS